MMRIVVIALAVLAVGGCGSSHVSDATYKREVSEALGELHKSTYDAAIAEREVKAAEAAHRKTLAKLRAVERAIREGKTP